MKCDYDGCWCQNGMRPEDMPNPAVGDPGRFHMQRATQIPGPWEWPIGFIGALTIFLLWRLG